MDWCCGSSDADGAPVLRGEERVECKSEALDLPVDLHPYLHLWSGAVGSDQKNEIADTSGGNKVSLKGS